MEQLQKEIEALKAQNLELMRQLDEAVKKLEDFQRDSYNALAKEPIRRKIIPKNN